MAESRSLPRQGTGYRQPPLQRVHGAKAFRAGLDGITVYAAPGYKLFVEGLWHGDYQQIPLEPSDVPALIDALTEALAHNTQEADPLAL